MKKERNNKKRLGSLVLLLLLTVVMLSTATYAWFTSNRLVRVNSLDVNVQASEGFQISVDGVNWKSVITPADIIGVAASYTNHTNHVGTEMVPVSTAAISSDATTGFLDFYHGQVSTDTDGDYALQATKITEAISTGQFIAFDLFFRTNNTIDLQLDQEAGVTDIATVLNRQNRGMENSARIAFVYHGNINPTTNPNPSGPQAQALISTVTDGSNVTIWEPNYKTHTEEAKIEAYNMYGISTTSTIYDNWIPYSGVSAAIEGESAPDVPNMVKLPAANATSSSTYFTALTQDRFIITDVVHPLTDTDIDLLPGVSKFRIYMWLEGQDYDCGDSASGSDIAFDLILSAVKQETP